MSATSHSAGQQDRPEARVCTCGYKDPLYHGVPSTDWSVKDGKDLCPDCAWMQSGPDDQLEAARTDPRGISDGLGS